MVDRVEPVVQCGQRKNISDRLKNAVVKTGRAPTRSAAAPRVKLERKSPTPNTARACPATDGGIPRDEMYCGRRTIYMAME